MYFDSNISELNGYLHSLQRLNGGNYSFGAYSIEAEADADECINKVIKAWGETEDKYLYKGKEKIEYAILVKLIEKFIFNGVLNRDRMRDDKMRAYATKMLIEDIDEYYGLASTSLDSNGVFNPLITGPVYRLNVDNSTYAHSLYFVVKIGKYFVLTYFRHRE